jgi:cell division protein FtsI/penicillin-binding protein 2
MQAVLAGLENAVEYGAAQRARVVGMTVAGKTGSVRAESGAPVAWFAGFAPSRAPEVAVAVALEGRSGGGDAAPVAGRILAAYRAGRL